MSSGIELLARSIDCNFPEIVTYRAEVEGVDLERPNIIGCSDAGHEALIIKRKFDAGLTDNQPKKYFSHLPEGSEGLLAFVCTPSLIVRQLGAFNKGGSGSSLVMI